MKISKVIDKFKTEVNNKNYIKFNQNLNQNKFNNKGFMRNKRLYNNINIQMRKKVIFNFNKNRNKNKIK